MSSDRMTELALQLMQLGVSQAGVKELLTYHELDEIERQIAYLPHRKAKRPEALIIEAVRNRYSPPKEFYYAADSTAVAGQSHALDEDPKLPSGPAAA